MGMDVYGRKPKNKQGEYFRTNIWGWRPIHVYMCEKCRFLSEHMLLHMGYNDGAGPRSQKVCDRIADKFQEFLDSDLDGMTVDLPMRVDANGCIIAKDIVEADPTTGYSPYHVDRDDIAEWIEFLRNCGGFAVW